MMDNLHYRISVRLQDPEDDLIFHTVSFLIPRDNLSPDLVKWCLVPEIKDASIEICGDYVIKRVGP